MPDSRPVVTVTRRLPEPVEARLLDLFDTRLNRDDHPMSAAELSGALAGSDGVLCTVTDRVDAAVFDARPVRARILANFGVGYNHVDLDAARRHGVAVTNTPDVLTDATADLALTLLLMVARRTGEGERELRAGRWTGWRPTHLVGTEVRDRTLGIVGLGRIGRAVATRASRGFGMRVRFHSPRPVPGDVARSAGATPAPSLEALLAESDFVSLHCPATPDTHHLINAGRLRQMKDDAFLINTARGDVVDEAALARAVRDGVIAGAGLDVYEREPQVHPDLLDLERVVLLPHLGSATREAREGMGWKAVANLEAWFRAGDAPDRVDRSDG